jgi:pyruvate/2-oxoglutarate dehydrogenase complex dihydrolipoamide dehydrogenase (E3) component
MADERYDAIVIETSQGGRFLPVELAKAGQKVALVERDQLGGVCVNRVKPASGGRLRLTVRTQDGERQLEGSHLLSAIGRIPNTEALTPEAAGIRLNEHGFIEVDEYLETSVPGVYAMGTSRAARPSPTFPTTITASCTPTSSGTRRRARGTGSSRTRCSSTRSLAAPA